MNKLIAGIAEKIRAGYYFFEDRYYAVLDRIDARGIKVYKAIDPIDRYFPSFLLFVLGFFVLIALLIMILLSPAIIPLTIRVSDMNGALLPDVQLLLSYGKNSGSKTTNIFGETRLDIEKGLLLDVNAQKSGYRRFSDSYKIEKSLLAIMLEPETKPIVVREIKFVNEKGDLITGVEIEVAFKCSSGVSAPKNVKTTNGIIVVEEPEGCQTLLADISIPGYAPVYDWSINALTNQILMRKDVSKGTVNAVVIDSETENGIEDVKVTLFASEGAKITERRTDSLGTARFEDVVVGTYYVSAYDASGKYAQKESGIKNLGKDEEIEFTLKLAKASGERIILKIVDAATNEAISGADVRILKGNTEIVALATQGNGIVAADVPDNNSNYSAVVSHEDYILKVERNLPVNAPGNDAAKEIKITKATATNSGKVIVTAVDETEQIVKGAVVYLYREDIEAVYLLRNITDNDGNAAFANLAAGNYFAKATSGTSKGESDTGGLEAGGELYLKVGLALGEGSVTVNSMDENGNALGNAKVAFYDSFNGSKINEYTTNEQGLLEGIIFKVDKMPYVVVGKAGYYNYVSPQFEIAANSTKTVDAVLYKRPLALEPFIEFTGLLETNGKAVTTVSDNKAYVARLRLVAPESYGQSVMHVRAGLDRERNVEEGVASIDYAIAANAAVVKSSVYNPADLYSDGSVTAGNAKQANIKWVALSDGSYEADVAIDIEDGLKSGTPIELHYRARVKRGDNLIETPGYVKRFVIGERICTTCHFVFGFELDDEMGETILLNDTKVQDLNINGNYSLRYTIFNVGNKDYSGLNLRIWNNPEVLKLSGIGASVETDKNVYSFAVGGLRKDTSFSGNLGMLAVAEASASSKLHFALDVNRADANTAVKFRVPSTKEMIVELMPPTLAAYVPGYVSVKVVNKDGTAIENATVVISKYTRSSDSSAELATKETNMLGMIEPYLLAASEPGDEIYFKVYRSGYADVEKKIVIGVGSVFLETGCITITPKDFNINRGGIKAISVTTNGCSEDLNVSVATICKDCQTAALALSTTAFNIESTSAGAKVVTVASQAYPAPLGQFPVIFNAKLASQPSSAYAKVGEAKFIVARENNTRCFAIDRTEFDINHQIDRGKITEDCMPSSLEALNASINNAKVIFDVVQKKYVTPEGGIITPVGG